MGFCELLLNPFGPIHEYDTPPEAVKFTVAPVHLGPSDPAAAVGKVVTVTCATEVLKQPWGLVAVTV